MRRTSVLSLASAAVAVVLLAAGGLLLWGSAYVHNTVQSQLSAQQITFPALAIGGLTLLAAAFTFTAGRRTRPAMVITHESITPATTA